MGLLDPVATGTAGALSATDRARNIPENVETLWLAQKSRKGSADELDIYQNYEFKSLPHGVKPKLFDASHHAIGTDPKILKELMLAAQKAGVEFVEAKP